MTAYRIVLLHEDRHEFSQAFEAVVINMLSDFPEISHLLEFSSTLSDDGAQQVVAYLASATGKSSRAVNDVIDTALARDVSILPVVGPDRPGDVGSQLPDRIAPLNAAIWEGDGTQVAMVLLEMLGLVEKERKIFISYRRSETSAPRRSAPYGVGATPIRCISGPLCCSARSRFPASLGQRAW